MRLIPALLAALAVTSNADAAPLLPAAVREVVKAMDAYCRAAGGKPGASPGLVNALDVNGDGRMDHVVYTHAFNCEGAASFLDGNNGGSVEVFVSAADGRATRAFAHGVHDMRIEQGELWLAVGGPLCGQRVTEDTPRSAMQACWRLLQWNAVRRKLDFAPLSSVRPYN